MNALRLSVGRDTTKEDIDVVVEDLKVTIEGLRRSNEIWETLLTCYILRVTEIINPLTPWSD